jgi:hypothetical protein
MKEEEKRENIVVRMPCHNILKRETCKNIERNLAFQRGNPFWNIKRETFSD